MKPFRTLFAAALLNLGLWAGVAQATPQVSLDIEGVVTLDNLFLIEGFTPFGPFGTGLSFEPVDDPRNVLAPYAALGEFAIDLSFSDPSPETERNWLLDIAVDIEGFATVVVFSEVGDPTDDDIIDIPFAVSFSETGIPISDFLGPFSTSDAGAVLGIGLIILESLCTDDGDPAGPATFPDTDPVLMCFFEIVSEEFEETSGSLSSLLSFGVTPDAVGEFCSGASDPDDVEACEDDAFDFLTFGLPELALLTCTDIELCSGIGPDDELFLLGLGAEIGLSASIRPVPEAPTIWLLTVALTAMVGTGFYRRRRSA